jgi:hypothetical protein
MGALLTITDLPELSRPVTTQRMSMGAPLALRIISELDGVNVELLTHAGVPVLLVVPRRGLEPPRPCDHYDLNVARLPVPPPGHFGKIRLDDFDAGVGECQRVMGRHRGS